MHACIKSQTNKTLFFTFILGTALACHRTPDLAAEKEAILVLHKEQQRAHFEKNAALLVGQASADYVIINRGSIKKPDKAESTRRFQSYFDSVDFVQWEDVSTPIFSFSEDATMATTVVEKLVITRQKAENNRLDTVRYAWIAVYKKNNGKWEMDRMASTNQ